jgi:cytosine/adenosine deaminase-related metal-dependent hydrolase
VREGTSVASELLGWDSKLGSIQEGKLADLIAVNEDPLADISALERVKVQPPHITFSLISRPSFSFCVSQFVMLGGKIVVK